MSQMKTLIEQNQQQANEILIQNPLLTKALFQVEGILRGWTRRTGAELGSKKSGHIIRTRASNLFTIAYVTGEIQRQNTCSHCSKLGPTQMFFNPLLKSRLSSALSSSSVSSSAIRGYTSNAVSLQTLLKRRFSPNVEQLNCHLLFLSEAQRFSSVIHFFSQFESNQIRPDSRSHSILARALLSLRRFDEAERLMRTQQGKAPNFAGSSMWDSLIQGYCVHQNDPEKGLSVLLDCLGKDGTFPSSYTFCSLVHSFSSLGMMGRAIEVLELMNDEKIKYPFGDYVCSSVISGFSRIDMPEIGVEFFYRVKNSGALRPSLGTYTALIDALCRLGRVDEVCSLVSEMEKEGIAFDVVFFTCWICGYVREGDLVEVVRKNKHMLEKRITGDVVSYTTLMDGFSKVLSVEKAGGVLAKMRKEGLEPNLITYTAVMSGFCKKGKLEEAITLFRMIKDMGFVMDEYVYATLIDGACTKGDYSLVFNLLDEMEKEGINSGVVTYNIVINGLCKLRRTLEADEFSKGMIGDIVTYTTLLNGYIGEENVEGISMMKRRLEEAGLRMDVVLCNVLIRASFLVGTFEDAYAIYRGMEDIGLIPNAFTCCVLINGFCKMDRIDQALEIFDDFRMASISSLACYNCIIHGLCKKGLSTIAMDMLIELIEKDLPLDLGVPLMLIKAAIRERNAEGAVDFIGQMVKVHPDNYSFICTEAIRILCKGGFPDLACRICVMMRRRSLGVTSKSYFLILKGLVDRKDQQAFVLPLLGMFIRDHTIAEPRVGKILVFLSCVKDINMGLRFLEIMEKENRVLSLPFPVFKKLISDGRALDAYKLVVDCKEGFLPNMDVVDYTTIIGSLCKGGYLYQALDLCNFARKMGIVLNITSYNVIIKGLCHQGRLIEAFRLYDSLERIGLVPSEITYGTLIDVLCKEGLMHEADKLFEAMVLKGHQPATPVYNSLIDGYCKIGQLEEALRVLHELVVMGLEADGFTISAVINGYCLKGDMEGARRLFSDFQNRGILPDFLGFLYLVRGLSTKGRIEEARNVLREMLGNESVVKLINKVDDSDVKDDSVYNFLIDKCERGNVGEAMIVLNEIASMYFPARRFRGDDFRSQKHSESHAEDIPTADKAADVRKNGAQEIKTLPEFDRFYSRVASLCSTGDIKRAHSLLKSIIC